VNKEDIWKLAIVALAAIAWWFMRTEMIDSRSQNVLQWQKLGESERCLMREVGKAKEEVAWIKGYLEGSRRKK
jgi:hypothetical protein